MKELAVVILKTLVLNINHMFAMVFLKIMELSIKILNNSDLGKKGVL